MENNIPIFAKEYSKILDELFTPVRYEEFRLILFQAKYFCSIFPIHTQSVKLNNAIAMSKHIAFM